MTNLHMPSFNEALEWAKGMIHQHGAFCMAGSSRNVDLKFLKRQVEDIRSLESEYRNIFHMGVDLIETDIPVALGTLINPGFPEKSALKYFREREF